MNLYSNHELRINDFAKRSFRDIADLDYIAARQASRAGLVPQFLSVSYTHLTLPTIYSV